VDLGLGTLFVASVPPLVDGVQPAIDLEARAHPWRQSEVERWARRWRRERPWRRSLNGLKMRIPYR
jgi:hypothetical protein